MRQMLLFLVVVAACGKSSNAGHGTVEDGVKQLAPKLEPRLSLVDKVAAQLQTISPKPLATPVKTLQLVSGGADHGPTVSGNAIVVLESELNFLRDFTHAPAVSGRPYMWQSLPACYVLARQGKWLQFSDHSALPEFNTSRKLDGGHVERICAALVQSDYLVVLRLQIAGARSAAGSTEDLVQKDVKGFVGGAGTGEAFVFAFADGSYLGSKTFEAKNNNEIQVVQRTDADAFDRNVARGAAAQDDLMSQLDAALAAALAKP